MGDGVLVDLGKEAESDQSTEDAQCTRDEERVLARAYGVGRVLLHYGEHISSYKRSDLACCCCYAVVLAANRGCAAFGGTEADVVAGAQFA